MTLPLCHCKSWALPKTIEVGIMSDDRAILEALPSLNVHIRVACPLCGMLFQRAVAEDGALVWLPATTPDIQH